MKNVLDIFEERGFVEQTTDPQLLRDLLEGSATCYIGFDPTAKSFHVGSLLPIMALVHMQKAGHRPIAVIGGGTGLVGDPSGKTETRPILTREEIDRNAQALKNQLSRFISFADDGAIMVNNADWLTNLNYIEFLRDIGRHFSVNRMLAAESYKARLETGLNFIEFNYMLLQAYDYWHLFKEFDCRLQMGGNDQWGNILAGADLIRRLEGEVVHALTFPLLTTSSGSKMGKTHKGAVWLDPVLTSPYDYYQYWINQGDEDVERFLALFTFLPMDEVRRLGKLEGADLRKAKEILAYEATTICHGREAADEARQAARELFGKGGSVSAKSVPTLELDGDLFEKGVPAYILFEQAGLCKTRGEARRLITQGGGYLNEERITVFDQVIDSSDLKNGELVLRAGKKRYLKITTP
ncbi:MAG: tyrosine--tRNA ligase [Deltaproteobacteria bacterium]|nr:MAG: tyrosine--tRNA ligase [Deltaproteobacteria bacterium]